MCKVLAALFLMQFASAQVSQLMKTSGLMVSRSKSFINHCRSRLVSTHSSDFRVMGETILIWLVLPHQQAITFKLTLCRLLMQLLP